VKMLFKGYDREDYGWSGACFLVSSFAVIAMTAIAIYFPTLLAQTGITLAVVYLALGLVAIIKRDRMDKKGEK